MTNKLFTIHYSLFTLIALLLVSCGYKPSSQAIQNVFSDKVYIKVYVDRVEPENAPFVRDEINRMVYTRFKGQVVSKEQAQSQIHVTYAGSTFVPLAYANGYVTRYLVTVRLHFDMWTKEGKVTKNITSIVESDIEESSLASSAIRIEALRKGLEKGMDEFLAYVSAKGILKEAK